MVPVLLSAECMLGQKTVLHLSVYLFVHLFVVCLLVHT